MPRWPFSLNLALVLLLGSARATPALLPAPAVLTPAALAITLNGLPVDSTLLLAQGEDLWIADADLEQWRIPRRLGQSRVVDGVTYWPLSAYHPRRVTIDPIALTADVQLDPVFFRPTVIAAVQPTTLSPQQGGAGGTLDYQLSATADTQSLFLRPQIFGVGGTLQANLQISHPPHSPLQVQRGALTYRSTPLNNGAQFGVGDVALPAIATGAPLALAGLSWYVPPQGNLTGTQPETVIRGVAERSSQVTVLAGAQELLTVHVPPGPFQITRLPASAGGSVQIVLIDDVGHRQAWSTFISQYGGFLRQGLVERWSAVGLQRSDDTFRTYGEATGTYRQRWGVTDQLTAELGTTITPAVQNFGVAATALLTPQTVLNVQSLFSSSAQGWGSAGAVNVGLRRDPWFASADLRWRSSAFQSVEEQGVQPAMFNLSGRMAYVLGPGVIEAQAAWLQQSGGVDRRQVSLGYTRSVGGGATLMVTGTAQRLASATAVPATGLTIKGSLLWPLTSQGTIQVHGEAAGVQVGVQGSRSDKTLNYALRGGVQDGAPVASGSVQWLTPATLVTATLGAQPGQVYGVVGATGRVGVLNGTAFATGTSGGAVALVQVADIPGVRVRLEGVLVGRTDQQGRLVVAGLIPLVTNTLTIETADLPFQVQIKGNQVQVVPLPGNSVEVRFPVERRLIGIMRLVLPSGQVVPTGAQATLEPTLEAEQEWPVGEDGSLYLELQNVKAHLSVVWSEGRCAVRSWQCPVYARKVSSLC